MTVYVSFCGLQAASLCAFEVLTAFLEQVEPTGDEAAEGSAAASEAVQAEYREARSMVYGVRAMGGWLPVAMRSDADLAACPYSC